MVHNRIDPPFTRYLDSDGRPLGELPAWAGDSDALVGLYRQMLLTRLFDQKAVALQRTGRIGTYAPTLGQEAIGVAIGSQMRAEDVLVPYYRDTAVQLMRGVRMEDILLSPLLGRRRARQRLRRTAGGAGLSHLRADRHPGPACLRGRLGVPHPRRTPGGGDHLRRRRHQQGRFPRGAERGGRLAVAGALRGQQQPVGDLGGTGCAAAPRSPTGCC